MSQDKGKKKGKSELLGFLIKDISHQHHKLIQHALTEMDLHHSQPRILFTVKDLKGASQKEIADRLKVSPASLAISLKRLQKAGFLERSADEEDQRVNKIQLTEKGRDAIDFCRLSIRGIDQQIQKSLSEEERETLFKLLHKVSNNLALARNDKQDREISLHNSKHRGEL